jgi:hypothetical protein
MKNIHVITAFTSNIQDMSDLSFDSLYKYCNKHNLQCNRYLLENIEREATWYKIPLILSKFDEGVDYVVWVDCDTTIINYDYDITKFLGDESVYIAKDINGINFGVMVWKRSDFTRDVLQKIWSMEEFFTHHWLEQAAFVKLVEDDYNGLSSQIKYLNQSEFNAYDYSLYSRTYPEGQVNDQSWLIHFAGVSHHRRIELIKQYKETYDISN